MTRLENLVLQVKNDMDFASIPYDKSVDIVKNNRLKSVAGKCRYKNKSAYVIEINGKMLENESDEFLKNVICHELLHSARECIGHGHKGNWNKYAKLMNKRNGSYNIVRCYTSKDVTREYGANLEYKYKVTCMECGHVYYYKRKTELIQNVLNGLNSGYSYGLCRSKDFEVEVL